MWNLNIGVLGHVDSGKTSLCRALSLIASTAAFDKSPQSQERGITLDLGFSSRVLTAALDPLCAPYLEALSLASREETVGASNSGLPFVPELNEESSETKLCCTFVDCPGHATLIRTIVGGAQIIDAMILVIDATKGVQAQTAECLVIGEILARPLVVVINKVDSLYSHWEEKSSPKASEEREKKGSIATMGDGMASAALQKLRKKLTAMFSKTRWPHVEMIEVSAAAPCCDALDASGKKKEDEGDGEIGNKNEVRASTRMPTKTINVEQVLPAVLRCAPLRELLLYRWKPIEKSGLGLKDGAFLSLFHSLRSKENFLMLSDHCFAVRGHGTVFSGTVLQGTVEVGDTIWLPTLQVQKKVKSLQVFKKQVTCARRGDRVGLCVTQLDASSVERGILCGCRSSSSSASGEMVERGGCGEKAPHAPCSAKNVLKGMDPQQVILSETSSNVTTDLTADLGATSLLPGVLLSPPRLTKVFIASVRRIRFHRLPCDTVTKFHIILGHTTVMGTFRYFSRRHKGRFANMVSTEPQPRTAPLVVQATLPPHKGDLSNPTQWEETISSFSSFNLHEESLVEEELGEDAVLHFSPPSSLGEDTSLSTLSTKKGQLLPPCPTSKEYYAVVLLEESVPVSINSTFVAMRLDVQREGFCRMAMTGMVQYVYPLHPCPTTTPPESAPEFSWRALPVYRFKKRTLQVCRVIDAKSCIANDVIHLISAQNGNEKGSDARHSEAQKFVGVPVYFVPFRALQNDPAEKSTSDEVDDKKEESNAPLNTATAVRGVIRSTFGKSGKVRLEFSQPIFVVENSGVRKKRSNGNEEGDECKGVGAKIAEGLAEAKREDGIPSSFVFLQDGEVVLEIRKSPFALHCDSLKDIRTH